MFIESESDRRGLLKVICFKETLESDQMEMISESHIETGESAYIYI